MTIGTEYRTASHFLALHHLDSPETYCAMANAGYDFIWTEMQHNARDWEQVARMWRACPHAKAVPGVRVAYTDEREIQHAADAGALVIVVTHDLGLAARFADSVLVLSEGRLVAQGAAAEALSERVMAKVFRISAFRAEHDGEAVIVPWAEI